MLHRIRAKTSEFVRSVAALVIVFGFLAALALTVTLGSLFRDSDGNDRRHRNPPSSFSL